MNRICSTGLAYIIILASICNGEFVPFVISEKINPDSPIACGYEPISTNGDRIIVEDGHFSVAGERIRLWGVNLSFGANMPSHEDAPFIAARMAASGVNTVRLHHMDTSFYPRGIWDREKQTKLSTEGLDRLDFFIDQLARHGIYVNLNLHVGRKHSKYLAIEESDRQYDKIANIFTPVLIDAQKKFARELLNHTNRYRNLRYADDPAVAIVEITNENSFFMWDGESTLRNLPGYYANILQGQFNKYLLGRYGNSEKLARAWSMGQEELGSNMLDENKWKLEQHNGCKAGLSKTNYKSTETFKIDITKFDETGWHLQINQSGLKLEEGKYYTLTFKAASEGGRKLSVGVGQAHEPWKNLGLSNNIQTSGQWRDYSFGFVASDDDENGRVNFSFGDSGTDLYIADIKLRPGGRVGLQQNENLEDGSVKLFSNGETPARSTDRMMFLAETEKQFFDDMRKFIKTDLKCDALVTGTIVFGPLGLYAQSDMDFIDSHAYWKHPSFPGRPWDRSNWLVEQKAMTDYPDEATLFRMACERLAGKPFTVTEYNHPAPNDYQAECVPMLASFAAGQDWDGVWIYTYSHSEDNWGREHISSFFDIDTNPAKWGFMRSGAEIFSKGKIRALGTTRTISILERQTQQNRLAQSHLKHGRNIIGAAKIYDWKEILKSIIQIDIKKTSSTCDLVTSTSFFDWKKSQEKDGYYIARDEAAFVCTGHSEQLNLVETLPVMINSPEFVSMTVVSLDGKKINDSSKILISACGRSENVGMEFSKDRRTVGTKWGTGPAQIEAVEARLTFKGRGWLCYAISADGLVSGKVPTTEEKDNTTVELSAKYKTMWYLMTKDKSNKIGTTEFKQDGVKRKWNYYNKIETSKSEKNAEFIPELPKDKKWKLVFNDEFDGNKIDNNKWTVLGDGPRKAGHWLKECVHVDNGNLVITTRKAGEIYGTGGVRSKSEHARRFGYYVARIKVEKCQGHGPAVWITGSGVGTLGDQGRDGTEIDIFEKFYNNDRIQHALHWDYPELNSASMQIEAADFDQNYHTVAVNWTDNQYVFYVDDQETWRTNHGGVSQVPVNILLSDEIRGWNGKIEDQDLPHRFYIDYVRVYEAVDATK